MTALAVVQRVMARKSWPASGGWRRTRPRRARSSVRMPNVCCGCRRSKSFSKDFTSGTAWLSSGAMTTTNLQVRRATVEDLQRLAPLWQQEHLPVSDLEKRFKEFQLIEAVGGELLGAIGLELAGPEGRLHGEVFAHADQSNALREKLWERAQVLASNHGLARLWTQLPAPFWQLNGFLWPSAGTAAKR